MSVATDQPSAGHHGSAGHDRWRMAARHPVAFARRAWAKAAIRATVWTMGAYGTGQVLRLVTNLILTRLVAPEAFGIMVLAQTFRVGLEMLSDIGIGPSIVQSPRGDDPAFINTAWTMQIVRGVLLWIAAVALAWPLAAFYSNTPGFLYVFPATALAVVIAGFNSTALYTLNRKLHMGRVTALNIITQATGMAATIGLAMIARSDPAWRPHAVWALVGGGIIGALVQLVGSHLIGGGGVGGTVRNRLAWEPEAARSIFRFGRWIVLSTLLTFLGLKLDQLLLGKLILPDRLGIYSIAQNLGTMLPAALGSLGTAVMFPVLARVVRESPERVRQRVEAVRALVLVPSACAIAVLVVFGPEIVGVLYAPAYHDAGWMLQIIAAGSFAMIIAQSYGHALLALGRSDQIVVLLVSLLVFMTAGTLIGYAVAGERGFVIGLALTEWLNYGFVVWRARRHGVYTPRVDAIVGAIAVVAIGVAAIR
ncbi:MAG: oligosaccharide flippase family protein [Phycisphaerales bacterium]